MANLCHCTFTFFVNDASSADTVYNKFMQTWTKSRPNNPSFGGDAAVVTPISISITPRKSDFDLHSVCLECYVKWMLNPIVLVQMKEWLGDLVSEITAVYYETQMALFGRQRIYGKGDISMHSLSMKHWPVAKLEGVSPDNTEQIIKILMDALNKHPEDTDVTTTDEVKKAYVESKSRQADLQPNPTN